jgi:tetratricopeptide (TPR) repeat protein/predicted Ser/Thr protein kinase
MTDDTELDPPTGSDSSALPAGTVLGRFTVGRLLGAGGMGAVYEARDPQLDRSVAIKVLPGDRDGGDRRRRLVREAQALAQLQHPHVVTVHEVGVENDRVFIAMELVDGVTLGQHLRAARRDWQDVVALFVQAGRGLAAAHAKGLVHRDFKPGNVLVDRDGRVRVTDFGLARLAGAADASPSDTPTPAGPASTETTADSGDDTAAEPGVAHTPSSGELADPLTRTGAFLGTPRYMAPEQFARQPATAQSDQFSFCVALWEGLFGEHPFAAGNDLGGLAATVDGGKLRPVPAGRRAPRRLVQLVTRGLAADPGDRHPSMTALVGALQAVPLRRRRAAIASAGVLLAAAAALGAIAITREPGVDCARAGAGLEAMWSPDVRAGLATRFAAARPDGANTAGRVAASLDAWTARWRDARVDACRATHERGEQYADLLDRRAACLDRGRLALAALVTGFATVDGITVDRAIDAVAALPVASDCAAGRVGPRDTRDRDPARASIVEVLARSEVAWNLGRSDEAARLSADAERDARALGDGPLVARVLAARGQRSIRTTSAEARRALEEALALTGGDDDITARVSLALLEEAVYSDDRQRMATLLPVARAAVQRGGSEQDQFRLAETEVVVTMLSSSSVDQAICDRLATLPGGTPVAEPACRCKVAVARQDLDDVLARCQHSIETRQARYGIDHPSITTDLRNVATAYNLRGDHEHSIALLRRALDIAQRSYGPRSTEAGLATFAIAAALDDLGRTDEALAAYDEATSLLREARSGPSFELGRALVYAAEASASRGDVDEADRRAREGLQIAEQAIGVDHKRLANLLLNHAKVLLAAGRNADAVAQLRRADVIARAHFDARSRTRLEVAGTFAQALTRAGEPASAIEPATHVVDAINDKTPAAAAARARSVLGEALARAGDRARGRNELLQARRILAGLGADGAADLARVDGLLRDLAPR